MVALINPGLRAVSSFLFIGVAILHPASGAQIRHFKWAVQYMYWSPDCVESVVMGINGQFPGPELRAQAGDTIVVELTNNIGTEGVVIHWHGIRQSGTYFYQGHYGTQRSAGLYGSLIVDVAEGEKEPFQYDDEFNLLLSDWWHKSSQQQEVGLSSKPFRWVDEAQVKELFKAFCLSLCGWAFITIPSSPIIYLSAR